jgi:hypothetical protein
MRQLSLILAVALSSVVWDVPSAGADTRAPSAQIFVLECGGASVTFVSPNEPAQAGQVVSTTGVGVLQRVVFSGSSGETVLFEQPSFQAHKTSALTDCTLAVPGGTVTFVVLATPQGRQRDS